MKAYRALLAGGWPPRATAVGDDGADGAPDPVHGFNDAVWPRTPNAVRLLAVDLLAHRVPLYRARTALVRVSSRVRRQSTPATATATAGSAATRRVRRAGVCVALCRRPNDLRAYRAATAESSLEARADHLLMSLWRRVLARAVLGLAARPVLSRWRPSSGRGRAHALRRAVQLMPARATASRRCLLAAVWPSTGSARPPP